MKMIRAVMLAVALGLVLAMSLGIAWATPSSETQTTTAKPTTTTTIPKDQKHNLIFVTTTIPPTTTTVPPTTTTTETPPPPPVVRDTIPVAGPCGGWEDLIAKYFPNEVGVACRVMMCETGQTGDPTIHNPGSSTASGMWQFLDRTWEDTTGTPAPAANYSAEVQTAAAAKLRNSSGWGQWSCY